MISKYLVNNATRKVFLEGLISSLCNPLEYPHLKNVLNPGDVAQLMSLLNKKLNPKKILRVQRRHSQGTGKRKRITRPKHYHMAPGSMQVRMKNQVKKRPHDALGTEDKQDEEGEGNALESQGVGQAPDYLKQFHPHLKLTQSFQDVQFNHPQQNPSQQPKIRGAQRSITLNGNPEYKGQPPLHACTHSFFSSASKPPNDRHSLTGQAVDHTVNENHIPHQDSSQQQEEFGGIVHLTHSEQLNFIQLPEPDPFAQIYKYGFFTPDVEHFDNKDAMELEVSSEFSDEADHVKKVSQIY